VKDELKGTGVWGFVKASRKPTAPLRGPSKPVPRAEDLRKPQPPSDGGKMKGPK
jgi:hypothetical protein